MPGQLAEQRRRRVLEPDGVARGQAVEGRGVAAAGAGRVEQEGAGGGALYLQTLRVDRLPEVEKAGDVIEAALSGRGDAQFLADLALLRGVGRDGGDGQADEIAVVGRVPMPEAPGRNRGDRGPADIPVGEQRQAAQFLPGAQIGVDIGQPVKGVGGGDGIALRGGERGILAVERTLGRAGAGIILHAAIGVLAVVIARQGEVERGGGVPEDLALHADIVLAVLPFVLPDIVDRAAAGGDGGGEAHRDQIVDQRAGNRCLALKEIEIAAGQLDPALRREAGRAGGDVDRAGGGVLAV